MRVTAQVLLGYAMLLVCGALWRMLPFDIAAPNIVALSAVYLGLTTRPVMVGPLFLRVAPSALGAVILGYLGDLLMGTPKGLLAFTAGVVFMIGHLVHTALIVRGRVFTTVFSAVTGLVAGVIALVIRAGAGTVTAGAVAELASLAYSALITGLIGPLVFVLCRRLDARFARTHRERDATLGGISR